MSFSQQSLLAVATACLITLAGSDAAAQATRQPTRQTGGSAPPAGQTGSIAASTAPGGTVAPSGAVTGQVGISEDRMLSEIGAQSGTGRGGAVGGRGAAGAMGGVRGFGGTSPFGASPFGSNNAAAQTPSVRTRLRSDIQTPALSAPMTDARVRRQLTTTPIQRRVNGLSISILDGVATIAGSVNSQRDRRMAELVLRLEPGIRQINNQIVVAP